MIAQSSVQRLEDLDVCPRARILFALIERVGYGNRVPKSGAALALELGMSRQVVNRHLAYYESMGVLRRDRQDGQNVIVLNEEKFWKGTRQSRQGAIRKSLKQRMKLAGMTGVVSGGKAVADKPDTA